MGAQGHAARLGRLPLVLRARETSAGTVPELDGLKEQLVYLRLWLGIVVVAEISLVGWFASAAETATPRLFWLAIIGIMSLATGIVLLHRRIDRRIEVIRRL